MDKVRVILKKKDAELFFTHVLSVVSTSQLAGKYSVSGRTIRAWKNAENSIPENIFRECMAISSFDVSRISPEYVADSVRWSRAGRVGGLVRHAMYGPLGTPDGRRKGGLHSIETHRKKKTDFIVRKKIILPRKSAKLAEFLGIMMGDGHLGQYQIEIVTSSVTDREHMSHVERLMQELFGFVPKVQDRKDSRAVSAIGSSVVLCEYLTSLGMPRGNKIKNDLSVPIWVQNKSLFSQAFIRGVFDTDGCVFLDKHTVKGKRYVNLGWTITSNAGTFIPGIVGLLRRLGFSPTNTKTQNSVYMRKRVDVERYFKEIGTNNPKHLRRYREFCGRVPKRSQRLRLEIG